MQTVQGKIGSIFIVSLLAVYVVIGTLFALRTPDWQAPDEPAHYNYIAQVASGIYIPKIQIGDWDNDYLEALKASRFSPDQLDQLDQIRYENHQPPLYYWLGAPIFALTNGSLIALRFYSVGLGVIFLILAWQALKSAFPHAPQVARVTLTLIAFIPQQIAIVSSVNNDALAYVVVAGLLWALIRYVRGETPAWWLGLGLGLAFITKTTTYFMAGVILIALFLRWWQTRDTRALMRDMLAVGLIAGVFALFWWGRNIAVYGFPDFLGLGAHDQVVIGQLRRDALITDIGLASYQDYLLMTTFQSFWGQFGWMAVPMRGLVSAGDNLVYPALLGLMIISLFGLVWRVLRPPQTPSPAHQSSIWVIFWAVLMFTLAMFVYYNLTFVQAQGRYLFTALIPFGAMLATGLDTLCNRLHIRLTWITMVLFGLFALLDLYLIWRVIPGALSY